MNAILFYRLYRNAAEAKAWCETEICATSSGATKMTCCIYHVNVHSCPLEHTDNGLCGPWISPGGTFTHSKVLVGPVDKGNWTSYISGLYQIGVTSLIAHFKFAGMQIALETKTNVLPRVVCGDDLCEKTDDTDSETCNNCPADCGRCPLESWEIALIVVAFLIFLASLACAYGYMQWQRRKLLWNEDWIIPPDKIADDEGLRGAFGSMVGSNIGVQGARSQQSSNLNVGHKQVFCRTALFDGRSCAVRTVTKPEFSLSKQVRMEVRAVRECDHPNLCKFVGACIEVPQMCVLSEYSAKGSLSDVLLNEEVPLNWAFRFSFESDIASAMKYLHGRGIIHGHLKANNCVVDDRWTIKITDYGLETLRSNVLTDPEQIEEAKYQQRRSSVYVAPELYSENGFKASMEGDAYAFAILMIEIALRADPYGDEDVFSLKLPWQPALPDFNPDKWENKDDLCPCPEAYNDLIQQCWSKQPSQRLTYDKIKAGIRKINPSNLSAIDLMMNMMEKYSKHLEVIVAERTMGIVAEKEKTETLLHNILPKQVAHSLQHGIPVEPKYHDWCSIYFSDVVGFTKLSGKSKPIEVVRMLNNLYIAFDEVIDHYDVYKVETIGDAYMVASGIPDFTEHHAREIANMSIDLVVACQHFVIPHLPDEPLKIRVGLHSGPVCAGVVGIKMPRYCLFGNTVQITSSMESNSIEYKIQISEACQKFLAPYGQFDIEERGKLTVMGVEWTTYWLHGRLPGYDPLAYSDEQ
ncbi:atrial natriuretic peptide receptor 1-like isoform X2 [Mya arenaria]|uniref:atrial natriuretic peptide receptor 1-like isoform X2 n=1 Tax=Mya arenaria TaxID=6604 RepID=UPI0022E13ACB|nr:atrial natriuretic peptide receptor 1-like isoform X2 [Mya arenaria]XP_052777458.1 atrial natriuretic peptide receptor 1-like isoform X2 [Mya arenaria]